MNVKLVICLLGLLAPLHLMAQPVVALGLTNTPLGQATLYDYDYLSVQGLSDEGNDGVSVHLGEADSGMWFWPATGPVVEGNFMRAEAFGRLNGTNDLRLAIVQGGCAVAMSMYVIEADFSTLAPESLTFQVLYNGMLQREITRPGDLTIVETYATVYPAVNPLVQKPDGTLGASIALSDSVEFIFMEGLASAFGNELFIRVNRPTNRMEFVSRLDIYAGGGVTEFNVSSGGLGVFHRPHRPVGGVNLHAAKGELRVDNLVNTNFMPGVAVDLKNASGFTMELVPFQLPDSNSVVWLHGGGPAGPVWSAWSEVRIRHDGDRIMVDNETYLSRPLIAILAGGQLVHTSYTAATSVFVPTNAQIGAVHWQARTAEALAGLHVRFAQTTSITISNGSTYTGDEVRFLAPPPARLDRLDLAYLSARLPGSFTITNEIALPMPPAPRLELTRAGNILNFKWVDPNRAYMFTESPVAEWGYNQGTNRPAYEDSYAAVTLQIDRGQPARFYRLQYDFPLPP